MNPLSFCEDNSIQFSEKRSQFPEINNAMLIITKHIDFHAADQVEAKHTSGEQVEAEQ